MEDDIIFQPKSVRALEVCKPSFRLNQVVRNTKLAKVFLPQEIIKKGMKNKQNTGGSLCGGVISKTQNLKKMKDFGVWADTMSWVMPDDKYEQYVALQKEGKDKEATKIFEAYARSQI